MGTCGHHQALEQRNEGADSWKSGQHSQKWWGKGYMGKVLTLLLPIQTWSSSWIPYSSWYHPSQRKMVSKPTFSSLSPPITRTQDSILFLVIPIAKALASCIIYVPNWLPYIQLYSPLVRPLKSCQCKCSKVQIHLHTMLKIFQWFTWGTRNSRIHRDRK